MIFGNFSRWGIFHRALSYMHVSGSQVMDQCIIGMYIMVTCIRIKNIYIAHAYIHQCQESYIHPTRITLFVCYPTVTEKFCIIDTCTIYTCMLQDQGPGSQICVSYIHTSESRIEEYRYLHHTCMYQDQASWINATLCIIVMCIRMDICIIHACLRIKDHGYMHHIMDTCIRETCIMDKCIIHMCNCESQSRVIGQDIGEFFQGGFFFLRLLLFCNFEG